MRFNVYSVATNRFVTDFMFEFEAKKFVNQNSGLYFYRKEEF